MKRQDQNSAFAVTRRRFIEGGSALLAAAPFGLPAFAEDAYPAREVHVIAAFPAGSGADVFTRYFAENMRPFLGGTIVVENKVGASGNLAINYVARAKPDGYTILIHAPSAIAAAPSLFKDPGFDRQEGLRRAWQRVPPAVHGLGVDEEPVQDMPELIAAVKAKGAKASYGTTAPTGQVAGAMMKNILKLDVVEVPYRTAADSVNDLDSGALDYIMYDPIFALPRHREGKIRVLAISSKERMSTAPEIPTMHESGMPGVDVFGWWGPAVPEGVPEPIKEKIATAFRQMAELPATKKWLGDYGGDPWVVGPEQAQKQMLADIENWAGFVKIANLEPKG